MCSSEGRGWKEKRREGAIHKEEEAEGGWRLQDMVGTERCVWHTSPAVDPSENVTLMNLKPKTGYSVRVQLSRPGEGGEGAWGPPSLMTTDCPGKKPRVFPSYSPGVYCHAHPEYVCLGPPTKNPAFPSRGCPSPTHWGLLSRLVPQGPIG